MNMATRRHPIRPQDEPTLIITSSGNEREIIVARPKPLKPSIYPQIRSYAHEKRHVILVAGIVIIAMGIVLGIVLWFTLTSYHQNKQHIQHTNHHR
jgi:hypothetical protein